MSCLIILDLNELRDAVAKYTSIKKDYNYRYLSFTNKGDPEYGMFIKTFIEINWLLEFFSTLLLRLSKRQYYRLTIST